MEEVKKYSVYVHTFPNGKKYVGGFLLLDRETYEKMKGGEG